MAERGWRVRPRQRVLPLVVVLVAVVAGWGAWQPVNAAFSAQAANPTSTFAAGEFDTGRLFAWGDTVPVISSPQRIGALSTWATAAAGNENQCATQTNGTLWCWGRNYDGRLGSGDTANRVAPAQVGSSTTWQSVSLGDSHGCATRTDGSLWCWGANGMGQVGVGNTTNQLAPVQVTSPATTGWLSVTTGARFTCATRTGGALYCWGENNAGQLGINSTVNQSTPALVSTPATTGWTSVRTGFQHACGLRTNLLFCWGDGGGGRLGLGSSTQQNAPVQVTGSTWSALSLGADHSCALRTTGTLWCWGTGTDGRLGNGGTTDVLTPVQVGADTTWRAVTGGRYHTCAARTDNTAWCFGDNPGGQLGVADLADRHTPAQAGSATTWASVSAGPLAQQTCGVRSDGSLWCWGNTGAFDTAPVEVSAVQTWETPSTGEDYGCATRTDGTLWCWGRNWNGRLGAGDNAHRPVPAQVGSATTWSSVMAGMAHACATRTDGTLWCWGQNADGQLGLGHTTNQVAPVQVTSPAATGWLSVTAGAYFTCAIRTGGALYCWGSNNGGQLGIGSTVNQSSPVLVSTPATTGWTTVRGGWQHACGLRTNLLFCWGDGGSGRLGLGSTAQQTTPAQVAGTGWSSFALGADHGCGLRTTGALWCWGAGADGRLGTGATTDVLAPVQIGSDTTWRTVSGGRQHTCATRTGGSVWCWGHNATGQLGFGDTTTRLVPTQLPGVIGRPVIGGPTSHITLMLRG
ncbi:RCC1 domain-containing protein [Spirilliplanes yamanashiensis]|uniref:RCC1-like domain-containing protein n=1 Tax=Spirilliplanes yamanashiensis TaxID=42233 RepID=A0A8J4DHU3_9ACTN|nr:RCC1 domain-containing protein [Spirilliplanes yamanashiensis]MDP9819607.1 alpha-tubulin suppressor-like RCC1 family protein [Spirilliplanes yamanashiensis]GIJ01573.1 hypothetical protein Sya03_09250 [Spirilliplanes yamanashiensis]